MWTGTALLAASLLGSCRSVGPTPNAAANRPADEKAGISRTATVRENKLIYPWSVVSGGVGSPAAMRNAMQEDPIVETHYAGLQPANFRAETLRTKRQGYVSYRIRDKIYWTKKMVTLQAGETVLTDGETMLRGRCGNMVSPAPREPLAPAGLEPAEVAMDAPIRTADLMIEPAAIAAYTPIAADRFVNPIQLGDNPDISKVITSPELGDSMPPAWAAGGIPAPGSGVMAGSSSDGGTPSEPTPEPASPETPVNPTPNPAVPTPPAPIEIAPPMVLTQLFVAPETPTPYIPFLPPVTYAYTPPSFPPYQPPSTPPQIPPQVFFPPTGGPPPAGPPPTNPQPPGPPPTNPPPTGPPPINIPPYNPPQFPPSDPPGVSAPEPSAWVLIALGIAGIAVGSYRRKS